MVLSVVNGLRWLINPWGWIPVLRLKFAGVSEFWPNVWPWTPCLLQNNFETFKKLLNDRLKHILSNLRILNLKSVGTCVYRAFWNFGMLIFEISIFQNVRCWEFGSCETLALWVSWSFDTLEFWKFDTKKPENRLIVNEFVSYILVILDIHYI